MNSSLKFNFLIALFLIAAFLLVSGQSAYADGKIDPYLQNVLKTTQSSSKIDVYLIMQDRLSYQDLEIQVKGMKRNARRSEVVRLLKNHAANSQHQVLSYLRNAEAGNQVENIQVIWVLNGIAFRATPQAIYDVAAGFNGVERIYFDAKYPIDELMDDNGITKYNREHGNFGMAGTLAPEPGLVLINAPLVWAEGDSGKGVVVGNIDTGTYWRHSDLIHNIWNNLGEDADNDGHTLEQSGATWIFDPGDVNGVDDDGNGRVDDFIGWDFDSNDNDPDDAQGHGTSTSGQVVGDGTGGTQTGVAPRAKVMVLKNNSGGESGYWLAQQYAIANGADIVTSSLSYKWYFSPQPNYPMFRQINDMELAVGIVHTNSTSNDGNTVGIPFNISAPGNSPGPWIHPDQTLVGGLSSVIGCGNVVATTDVIASSSPWGPTAWEDFQINHPSYPYSMPAGYQDYPYETAPGSMGLIKPDVSAPGNGTISTAMGGGYTSFSGTSSATPHTAGTAALVLGANPDLMPADVSRILQTTAIEKGDPGKDNRYGAGRIDAYEAYLQAFAEAGTPFSPSDLQAYSDYTMPNSMELTWEDPTNLINGDTLLPGDFHIYIQRDGALIDSVTGSTLQYQDTGLNDGQEYLYQIHTRVDSSGRESDPIETVWIAGGSPMPTPPLEVGISKQVNQVLLRWRNPNINIDGTPIDDLAGINLYRDSVLVATFNRTPADSGKLDSAAYAVTLGGFHQWYLTAFDNESPANESIGSATVITPLSAPILDVFNSTGMPDSTVWQNDDADINDRSSNPPSGVYALNMNGKPDGGDMVELYPVDLSGYLGSGIVFSYWYQPQGNGNAPEPEDSLLVYFKNNLGNWVLVAGYPGTGLKPFRREIIDLTLAPNGGGDYFHSQFQVRFRNYGSASTFTPNDDWFIDDIYLGIPAPVIAASADSVVFDTTFVDSTKMLQVNIHNIGFDTLEVSDVISPDTAFTVDMTSFSVAADTFQTINVIFAPQQIGWHSDRLMFLSNDLENDTLEVYVKGFAQQTVGITDQVSLPRRFAVRQNYPNPFNPTTTIFYELPKTSDVKLVIYNLLGQRVRTLLNDRLEAGRHEIIWDAMNDQGYSVSSGVYIYRFEAGDYTRTLKMILMR